MPILVSLSLMSLSPFRIPANKKRNERVGYSQLDWNQLPLNSPSQLSRITVQELSQHDKTDDCWIAIQGKVYDITKYIPYHPYIFYYKTHIYIYSLCSGGKIQIERGKGKDATELFFQAHPWVNADAILKKCWIGYLIR